MPPARRDANGRRLYGRNDIARLRFVARCRALGFPLGDAVALPGLAAADDASSAAVEATGERHLADVRAEFVDLRAMEVALADPVQKCDDGGGDCPVLAELFR